MDIRLYWEKVYWALAKRAFKRKQKTYEDWLAKGYTNQPLVSFIIESHNKSVGVKRIVSKLREYPNAEIVVIDDGSEYKHTKSLMRFLTRGNEFLVRANDLYENVMYDKTIRFANGEYIVLMQDDDEIIRLRVNIRKAAEAKVENGTLTVTDMLREITAENLARQTKALHEVQLLMNIWNLKYTLNN